MYYIDTPCYRDPSNSTVQTVTYNDWSTRNGVISHQVALLVTPNALVSFCVCVPEVGSILWVNCAGAPLQLA